MSKFSLLNKFIVQEGKNEEMVDILLEAAESMKNLDECEIYLVNIAENEPVLFADNPGCSGAPEVTPAVIRMEA